MLNQQNILETDVHSWYTDFQFNWRQGEHVSILGGTGTGKTTVAHTILDTRVYVCVLAVKRNDDTLDRFRNGTAYGRASYKIITKFPPDYPYHKVILWIKPGSLADRSQAERLYEALNRMYMEGGWCIYFDEAGFVSGSLGLGKALGVLLNQGRSSGLSVVCTMTRPSSIIAQVPKESLNQTRHKIIFKYTDENEVKACAQIVGMQWRQMVALMDMLSYHGTKQFSDFLVFSHGTITLVRNTGDD